MKSIGLNGFNLAFTFLGGVVVLFIFAPLAGIFLNTQTDILADTLTEKEVRNSISLTLSVSFAATLFFSVFSVPFAYLLARNNFRGKQFVLGLIDLPIVIPHSAAGIAVLGIVAGHSSVGKFFESVGISFVGHPLGIGLAMAFVSIPFLINSARDGFEAVPVRLEKVAYTLGASKWRTFYTISVPLAWRSILSGFILMFARGMSEFGAVIIIAYHPTVTPVLIYDRFGTYGLDYARAVSVIFIVVSLIFFILLRLISGKKE